MKVTEQMELDYGNNKVNYDSHMYFITRDTIKDFVASELFIPVIEELYDKNIFSSWSGLERDAHIRIPLDGLSRENYLILAELCKKGLNWRYIKPPYGNKDIIPNYSFELFVEYVNGETEVEDVVKQLIKEVRKLRFQDVQIARDDFARDSKLPRVTLKGLYNISETSVFDIKKQEDVFVPAEDFEELSEMFLNGNKPQYVYDEETDTYFKNKELISKSQQYRIYENETTEERKKRAIDEINKMIDTTMSDEEKYRIIFEWVVNNFDYEYSCLYDAYRAEIMRIEREKNLVRKYYFKFLEKHPELDRNDILKCRELFLNECRAELPEEVIKLSEELIDAIIKSNLEKQKEEKISKTSEPWISRYGVCNDFANIYDFICKRFNLPSKVIKGHIDSNNYNVGHAWNAVIYDGETKHIDVSSAIHCKDGHNSLNDIYDYFGKTFEELLKIDNGSNRTITKESQARIEEMEKQVFGWNFGD